jgi:hypothetical protein
MGQHRAVRDQSSSPASPRQGTLTITFSHPASAFLYRTTAPRLRIDGTDVAVPGWGSHRYPLAAGRHRIEVWVPYAFPRRAGRAKAEVAVNPGKSEKIEYMAPTFTFAGGALGAPGKAKSAGFSTVMIFNVLAVVALITAFVATR